MAGTETHGYDLVIEFAERACQDILSAFFDAGGLLSTLLDAIHAPAGLSDAFSVVVTFDRPAGVPASSADVLDVRILLGEGGTGTLGHLRIVAGITVDRSGGSDVARVDIANQLHITELDIAALSGPANSALNVLFRNQLRNRIPSIPLLPIPVDRTTTSAVTLKAGDVRLVDDTAPADADALGFLLTFGGGTAGTRSAFTRSFLAPTDSGGIAIAFPWLCRVVSPLIDNSLNLGGAFTNCTLTRSVRIDADNEVDLTALTLRLDDGFIAVAATVTKSGFCYDARGTVSARIRMEVVDGRLVVNAEVDDPSVSVDIPWYCWLAGAVIGAIVMGVIGAILVPLIMYIAQESVEGTINSVAQRVADAVNALDLNTTLPVPGVSLVFQRVFIDDVTIGCRVAVDDRVAIRSEGIVVLRDGLAVDLDTGKVGPKDLGGADLACVGRLFDRHLRAVCGARLARTDRRSFVGVMRSTLYGYTYSAPNPIPLGELAGLNPLGVLFGDPFNETDRVMAVHTNEGRYAVVQAVEVDFDTIRLRYRTWEKLERSLEITGGFSCDHLGDVRAETVQFEVSPALAVLGPAATTTAGAGERATAPDPCAVLAGATRAMLPKDMVQAEALRAVPLEHRRIGRWAGTEIATSRGVGRFDAVGQGFGPDPKVFWKLNDVALDAQEGDVDVDVAKIHYRVDGTRLVLTPKADREFEVLVTATMIDGTGEAVTVKRCVLYEPRCTRTGVRFVPSWTTYQAAYLQHFGVVEVPVVPAVTVTPGGSQGPVVLT